MGKRFNLEPDVLRVELELDVEVVEALVVCSSSHPDLSLAGLTRHLLVQEALRIAVGPTGMGTPRPNLPSESPPRTTF